jgi:hypothetical protein
MVAQAMSQVLGVQVLPDTTKTFWELGGTSLMAMTLDGALQAATGGAARIGIAKMMQDGSVAGMARLIDESLGAAGTTVRKESSLDRDSDKQQDADARQAVVRNHAKGDGVCARDSRTRRTVRDLEAAARGDQLHGRRSAGEKEWRQRRGRLLCGVRQLVGLHSALRTKSFFMQRGKHVLQEIGWKNDEFDWQWTAVESEAEASAALSSDAKRGWDLESGVGVVRVRATSVGGSAMVAVWMHHIVGDEWSMDVLRQDFKIAASGGVELQSSKQLWEFAEWEWELLQREGEAMSAWWRQHLQGCKALRLEGMMTESSAHDARVKMVSCKIAPSVADKAKAAAQAAGVSLFAVWQGVFAAWAHRNMEEKSLTTTCWWSDRTAGATWRSFSGRWGTC